MAKESKFYTLQGHGSFLLSTASRPALEHPEPPIQSVSQTISQWVKWPGCEADHTPPSSAKVKNTWSYIPISPSFFMASCMHNENFIQPLENVTWCSSFYNECMTLFKAKKSDIFRLKHVWIFRHGGMNNHGESLGKENWTHSSLANSIAMAQHM
jgi:hypothetical protein